LSGNVSQLEMFASAADPLLPLSFEIPAAVNRQQTDPYPVNRDNLAEHTYSFLLTNRRHFLVSLSSTALFGGLGIVKDVIFLKISDNLD